MWQKNSRQHAFAGYEAAAEIYTENYTSHTNTLSYAIPVPFVKKCTIYVTILFVVSTSEIFSVTAFFAKRIDCRVRRRNLSRVTKDHF